jgi:hypothetical protein
MPILTSSQVWDEWSELTQDTVLTHFQFSVPLDAPPSFITPAVRLQWLLRFCFTAQVCLCLLQLNARMACKQIYGNNNPLLWACVAEDGPSYTASF